MHTNTITNRPMHVMAINGNWALAYYTDVANAEPINVKVSHLRRI